MPPTVRQVDPTRCSGAPLRTRCATRYLETGRECRQLPVDAGAPGRSRWYYLSGLLERSGLPSPPTVTIPADRQVTYKTSLTVGHLVQCKTRTFTSDEFMGLSLSSGAGGITRPYRAVVTKLNREFSGPFTPDEARALLKISPARTYRLLAYLAERGWLVRIRRGLYAPVPLDAPVPSDWREDPWLVALHTFEPCYIGGWSACEHWHLTEQIFRGIVVFTTRRVRSVATEIQGSSFRVRRRRADQMFGLRKVWRRNAPVPVSDPSRTIVDILDDPSTGGGIRHVADVLRDYFESEHRDDDALVAYAAKLGNATAFKRLGFLIEVLEIAAPALIEASLAQRSKGITLLDPSVKRRGRISRRWNLNVNVSLDVQAQ
jgi:predicted transcriptional regulator of viral defense system